MERIQLLASQFDVVNGEQVEYPFETDVIIVDDETVSKVVIMSPFETMHHVFNRRSYQEQYRLPYLPNAKDILNSLSLDQTIGCFLSASIMSLVDLFNEYRHHVVEMRRENEMSKADAAYIYYGIGEIESELSHALEAHSIDMGDAPWFRLVGEALAQIHDLTDGDGRQLARRLEHDYLQQVLTQIKSNHTVYGAFKNIVWTPLKAAIEKEARQIRRPALRIVK